MRRVALVVKALKLMGHHSITVFGRSDHAEAFGIEATHFETRTTANALESGNADACRWHERLPDLTEYEVVVSDNLPEILAIRKDARLMGSFLWHLALPDVDAQYRVNAEGLLRAYKPEMVGSGFFAAPEVREQTRYRDVGLLVEQQSVRPGGMDLLISCGMSDESLVETECAVRRLMGIKSCRFRFVYVEPRVLPRDRPQWMHPATFNREMYASLAAAVVRPGVGTLTELLQAGAKIFCFYESGNRELEFNARQIEAYGLGSRYGSADAALKAVLDEKTALDVRRPVPDALPMQGAANAAQYFAQISAC